MIAEIQVTSPESSLTYTTLGRIGGTDEFTLYSCSSPEGASSDVPKVCILKIAADPVHNATLDREAFLLKSMLTEAARLEEAYLRVNPDTEMRMNYNFFFPNLVETFVSGGQRGRRVLVLSFDCIANSLGELVPLSHLESRGRVRVDQQTSAWVLGKMLKAFVMTHGLGIINHKIYRENILINEDQHFVSAFDWSKAEMEKPVDPQKGAEEIAQLAQAVTLALGGDLRTGKLPPDEHGYDSYGEFVRVLALGRESDAQKAHCEFYAMVDRLWPKEFHPFTTYPLG
jgi:hypothetical protein